ncbi:hypothetical protein GHK50_22805 [Sinorhizobium medicae]|uniref:Uncharacterized protein n=1 Tax=Sinorhizobium medicae TaxID=110321 RepID=A0A6G1WKT5_9HYPH|nr:hypothetical protein [Sinorhizobium medicae]MDX0679979.1 hypothetical protein [Sinorhizobium medicae]MDX0712514.1 hypothetical protein [Sinorhizobium medicae]MDX0842385.1 hypothetical protein [Sinorhizobium medicae]MDX0855172.1 hypothetical protein [Sinorhizobium medicae]
MAHGRNDRRRHGRRLGLKGALRVRKREGLKTIRARAWRHGLSIVTLVATKGRQPEGGRHVHAGREAANDDDN